MTAGDGDTTDGQDDAGEAAGQRPTTGPRDGANEVRVEALVDELTHGEKRVLLRGRADPDHVATGWVPPIDRLGVPSFSMVDGPMGIRAVTATAFPATLSLASSWDPDLAREYGHVLATEARGADQDALLAPGVNLLRVPQCGRSFEYYSEDPTLTAEVSRETIRGIQDAGVMATVKHYVCNNQETDRHHVSADVGERALRELYLPAFEAAVREADVASVMAAYNRIDGTYATAHRRLLRDVLRDDWGFDGFVVSDWWATFDGPAAAEAGLDVDMPGVPLYEWTEHGSRLIDAAGRLPDLDWLPKQRLGDLAAQPWQPENPNPNVMKESPFADELTAAIESGRIDESLLDEKVRNLLRQYDRFGLLQDVGVGGDGVGGEYGATDSADEDVGAQGAESDADAPERVAGRIDAPEHRTLARRVAERGTVLLKNEDDVLPLDPDALDDVALIGPHVEEAKTGGGGSSEVDAVRTISPAAGLRARLEPEARVRVERGVDPVETQSLLQGLLFDHELPDLSSPARTDAVAAAREADVAVVVVQDDATEGADRDLALPGDQDELVARVAAAAPKTVVVCNTAGPVEMPWLDGVDAVLEAWYPGQEDGAALANVLCGDADPAGRLPATFAPDPAAYPASTREQYPGVGQRASYSEGVFVGYRHFDATDEDVLFPFGHGESYAEFAYGDLDVEREEGLTADGAARRAIADADADGAAPVATATVAVENVADRDGREVVQAYVAPPENAIERPPRELVDFQALALDAGEERTVELAVAPRDLAYYDEVEESWVVDPGEYELRVGRSSRDHRATATFTVDEDEAGPLA